MEDAIHVIVQINPSCCIEVRTSFQYKINLEKVLSKLFWKEIGLWGDLNSCSTCLILPTKDGIIMLDKGQGENKLLDSPNYFLLDSKQDCCIVLNAWELGVTE